MGKGKYGQIKHFRENAIRAINGYIKLLQRQQQAEKKKETGNGR